MKKTFIQYFIAALVAFVIYAVLVKVRIVAFPPLDLLDGPEPWARDSFRWPLLTLSQALPALCAGLIVRRNGLFFGALIGITTWIVGDYYLVGPIHNFSFYPVSKAMLADVLGGTISTGIIGSISCYAGTKMRRVRP